MTTIQPLNTEIETQMQDTLAQQKAAYLEEGVVSAETRIDRIDRDVLLDQGFRFVLHLCDIDASDHGRGERQHQGKTQGDFSHLDSQYSLSANP